MSCTGESSSTPGAVKTKSMSTARNMMPYNVITDRAAFTGSPTLFDLVIFPPIRAVTSAEMHQGSGAGCLPGYGRLAGSLGTVLVFRILPVVENFEPVEHP